MKPYLFHMFSFSDHLKGIKLVYLKNSPNPNLFSRCFNFIRDKYFVK